MVARLNILKFIESHTLSGGIMQYVNYISVKVLLLSHLPPPKKEKKKKKQKQKEKKCLMHSK